ncbi:hypothetical protein HNP02_008649 [Mycobacterium sp. AZCC_0083]|nr:hypothetical protein [Mycobacterium sp. AZCC_0083]
MLSRWAGAFTARGHAASRRAVVSPGLLAVVTKMLHLPPSGRADAGRPQDGCSAALPIGVHTTDALSYNGISR